MKKLKFILLGIIFSLSAAIVGLVLPRTENPISASANVTNNSIFEYLTFSEYGHTLTADNFTALNDGKNYLVTNNNVTITFDILKHPIRQLTFNNSSSFKESTVMVYSLKLLEGYTNRYQTITYHGQELQPRTENSIINLYNSNGTQVLSSSNVSQNLLYLTNDTELQLHIVDSYTYHGQDDAELNFYISSSPISINFVRPSVKFSDNSAVKFITSIDGDTKFGQPAKDQEFNSVTLELTNYSYTEYNPLYYNINYNGFNYLIKMYTKNGNFYANYTDTYTEVDNSGNKRTIEHTTYLATGENGSNPVSAPINSNNYFKITFNNTGRYEIKIYDSTYAKGLTNNNIKETSFYIKSNITSDFENIYMIAQKIDSNGNLSDYIYSNTTQNSNILLTIKNLNNFKDNVKLEDVISKIELIKTDYSEGTSRTKTTYSASQVKNMIKNNDLILPIFDTDEDYRVIIYNEDETKTIEFRVTIALTAKTHYNANGVNESATIPYTSTPKSYTQNPKITLPLTIQLYGVSETKNLENTGTNTYTINYALKQVSMEKITLSEDGKNEIPGLHLEFKGVGNITVTINHDGNIEERVLTPDNRRISLTEYGKYTITMVDSMGTTTTNTYSYNKPLNASTIILIVLSSVILVVVVVFLVLVRKRIKTR